MPLSVAPLCVDLKIQKVSTDGKTKKHLESLGLTINSTLKLITVSDGNSIVEVKNGRLALDRNIATKISVLPLLTEVIR